VSSVRSLTRNNGATLLQIVSEYEERMRGMPFVSPSSYGRRMLRDDGAPNKIFLMFLFCGHAMAIQFMQDVGLIRTKAQCNTCGTEY
jgi:hypothetical protein